MCCHPPTISTKTIKKIGSDLCKFSNEALSDNTLTSKGKGKEVIGSPKLTRKVISSKKEKAKGKMEEAESQELIKKPKY